MNIISWIIFGAIAGWLASLIMNTDQDQGALANIMVGILGALLGGFIVEIFGKEGVDGFNLWSFFVAILGSVVLLMIYRAMRKQT